MEGGIPVFADKDDFEIDPKDAETGLRHLEGILEPGMPVIVENVSSNTLPMMPRQSWNRHLFFSDGTMQGPKFNLQRGKKNYGYIVDHSKENPFKWYMAIAGWQASGNCSITMPWSHTQTHYNEGTFSPAGGTTFHSHHGGRTTKVIAGERVWLEFPDATRAASFVSDAHVFRLNSVYSMPAYLINEAGVDNGEKHNFEHRSSKIASVQSVRRLLVQLGHRDGMSNDLHIDELSFFHDISDLQLCYPVTPDDFIIRQLSHPCRTVAFVKAGRGLRYEDTYILPARGFAKTVEKALRHKRVDALYPACAEERRLFR